MTSGAARPVFVASAEEGDPPPGEAWLTAAEREVFGGLRFEKRARQWRLGRWTAKAAVTAWLAARGRSSEPRAIEVLAAADGAPEVTLRASGVRAAGGPPTGKDGGATPVVVSLSHSGARALAVAADAPLALGCDVEAVAPRTPVFVRDYLTERERAWVEGAEGPERPLAANLVWSAKESALKALREGLRVDTRSVDVVVPAAPDAGGRTWRPLGVHLADGRVWPGHWRVRGGFVETVVTGHPCRLEAVEPPSTAG